MSIRRGPGNVLTKRSAGLLIFRETAGDLEVFLVHPGGPFWAKKDEGSWSIPKGEIEPDEDPLEAAKRELREETGFSVDGDAFALEPLRQPSGKIVSAWAIRGDVDPAALRSETFAMEWPPGSGRQQHFPEVDRGGWFSPEVAASKMLKGQLGFLTQLIRKLLRES